MKRKNAWVKSLSVCLSVIVVMGMAGFFLLNEANEMPHTGSKVEAFSYEQNSQITNGAEEIAVSVSEEVAEEGTDESKAVVKEVPAVVEQTVAPSPEIEAVAAVNQPVDTVVEQPAPAPAVNETAIAPVTYNWGGSSSYTFRMEVAVTNNGVENSKNVIVSVPLLESSSPYQTTTLKSVNYDIISTSGRVSTFNLGDLAPGETKVIIADFNISLRIVSFHSSNETVEKARLAYENHKGSGNCRTLALAFINEVGSMGITAREVIGFARPQRGAMTPGSLQGYRHSWAEFYVDGLGWLPVDLTFQYFGGLPQTSHIVESYGDQSINVNYKGGSLDASWSNSVL